jgi:hypothetical protein
MDNQITPAMTVGELLSKLKDVPSETRLWFLVKGAGLAPLSHFELRSSREGCPFSDDPADLNPNYYQPDLPVRTWPHLIFSTGPDEQVNKLVPAIEALVAASPNPREAVKVKGQAGISLTPNDLDLLQDWPTK